ncbi:hypothetical protein BpHYR1_052403 [Brachionus plicatilis]|uniref:Uncharacterized protein n=1 Tax=Brachionus plicatilis TaxID=10195 RepID=A0A3M7R385_BRAPC|nr:hypothetical protein BpHYR1_052403 [Brachionus plicatilis]
MIFSLDKASYIPQRDNVVVVATKSASSSGRLPKTGGNKTATDNSRTRSKSRMRKFGRPRPAQCPILEAISEKVTRIALRKEGLFEQKSVKKKNKKT